MVLSETCLLWPVHWLRRVRIYVFLSSLDLLQASQFKESFLGSKGWFEGKL